MQTSSSSVAPRGGIAARSAGTQCSGAVLRPPPRRQSRRDVSGTWIERSAPASTTVARGSRRVIRAARGSSRRKSVCKRVRMDNRTRRPSPVVAVLGGLLLLSSNEACVSPTPPIAAVTPAAQPTPRTLPPQLPRGSRLQPPRLTLTASGPVLIRVTADTAPGEPVNGIRVERAPETGGQEFFFFGNGFQYEGSHGSAIQYALPDTTYRYRATAVSGRSDLLDSAPSEEVSVRTPSEPDAPPAAPTWLVARAVSPFAIELDWDDRSDNEYGFEVEQRTNEGKFARVALVDPDRPRFVDHNLAPGTEGRYRVRAFNPRGTSPATEEAAARTPPVAEHPTTLEDVAPHPAPCTSREEALRMVDDLGDPEVPVVTRMDLGHGRVADLVEQPSSCGSGGCG